MHLIDAPIRQFATLLAASLALTGCVSLGPETPESLIALTPLERAGPGDLAGREGRAALVVLDPDADRRIDVLRVPVQIDASRVAYLEDAVWVEKPARQFRRLLAETLRARTREVVVEGADFEVTGETIVAGRLVEMGYDARQQAVIVRYDAIIEESGGAVRSRRFESTVSGVPAEAAFVVPALNEAANEVAQQAASWIIG